QRLPAELLENVVEVAGQTTIEAGNLLAVTPSETLACRPLAVGVQLLPQCPKVLRVGGTEVLDPFALESLADRFKERLAVTLDQLAAVNGLAVGPAESGPRQHVGEHDAHVARRPGTERQPAQVQPVIADGQSVADRRHEQIGLRHAEAIENEAVVLSVFESV